MTRVHFALQFPQAGGGNLRAYWPQEALRDVLGHDATSSAGYDVPDCEVLVIHRPLARDRLEQVLEGKRRGIRVICDEDDALDHAISGGNEIAMMHWTPEVRAIHDEALQAADHVTVTTVPLLEHYRPLNPNITIIRNRLPRRFGEMRVKRVDPPTVGWFGVTFTHRRDLKWLRPQMERLWAPFECVGDEAVPLVIGSPGAPVMEFTFSADELYQHIARWSVGMVPLVDHPFNHCKSWLKAIEYMTMGVVPVVRRLPEQELLVEDGVNGFLVDEPDEMIDRVNMLTVDHGRRQEMSVAAAETGREYALENHIKEWEDVLMDVQEPLGACDGCGEELREGQVHDCPVLGTEVTVSRT